MYRKFFKMRYDCLGRDFVDLSNYSLIQLTKCVQFDGVNCGVICLKVIEKLLVASIKCSVIIMSRWLNSCLHVVKCLKMS